MGFAGFPRGTGYTPVPNPLFGPLLEGVQDLAEIKVTLRGLWLLHRKRGWPRAVSLGEFLSDRALLRGLEGRGKDPAEEIRRGLQLAVVRGTFLLHRPAAGEETSQVYVLNSDSGQDALARMRREGLAPPGGEGAVPEGPAETPAREKPNIFGLYEANVGMVSPLLAEQLKEAEEAYPRAWIEEAFEIAVAENKRSWRYIAAILRRWAAEGKGDGKPGRHSEKDSPQKYLEEYQRRRGHLPWEPGGQGRRGGR